jgi:hypothetical protein
MLRRAVVGIVGVLALVLSPFYGCHAETRFDYDEDDMRAAVEGTWVLRVPATETAAAREITFTLTQASKVARRGDDGIFSVRAASACSSRTFVRPAHACIDSTTMPLDVEVIAGLDRPSTPTGRLLVEGTGGRWMFAELRITLDGSTLTARLERDGAVESAAWDDASDGVSLTRGPM